VTTQPQMTTVIDHTVTQPMSTTTPRHLQSQCHFTEHDFLNRHCIYVYYYIFFTAFTTTCTALE